VNPTWKEQPERGNRPLLRLMAWIATSLGRSASRLLLYPICLYFVCFSGTARRAIRRFRERALGRSATWTELFRHYYTFASTILDRVYFLQGRFELFDLRIEGLHVLNEALAQKRGCLLLGSHLGSFEVVRAVGLSRKDLEVRVLMDEQNAPMLRALIQHLNPAVADTVIQIGRLDSMLQVQDCLMRGAIVGIMGDRVTRDDHAVDCRFFGRPARFPTGAIRLAHVVNAPVILFFGLYRGGNRYDIHLEPFSEDLQLPSEQRQEALEAWTQRYATRLEQYCRQAPDNWFNFYEFWHDGR